MIRKVERLILHVGYPKTGTTTLQSQIYPQLESCWFLGKRDESEQPERMFVHPVLAQARDLVNNANDLQVSVSQSAVLDGLAQLVEQAPHPLPPVAVLSLEGFTDPIVGTHLAQHKDLYMKARHLSQMFTGPRSPFESCDIFITIRRQEQMVPSYFAQSSHRGVSCGLHNGSWQHFLDMVVDGDPIGLGMYFEFDRVCSLYREFFGGRVHIAPIEGLFTAEPTAVQEACAQFFGVPLATLRPLLVDNTPKNARAQRVDRSMQYSSGWHTSGSVNLVRRIDNKLRGAAVLRNLAGSLEGFRQGIYSSRFSVTDAEESRLRARFAESNARLERAYGLELASLGYATSSATVGAANAAPPVAP